MGKRSVGDGSILWMIYQVAEEFKTEVKVQKIPDGLLIAENESDVQARESFFLRRLQK